MDLESEGAKSQHVEKAVYLHSKNQQNVQKSSERTFGIEGLVLGGALEEEKTVLWGCQQLKYAQVHQQQCHFGRVFKRVSNERTQKLRVEVERSKSAAKSGSV